MPVTLVPRGRLIGGLSTARSQVKTPHPGTVGSDVQAFEQMSSRFRQEVGGILARLPPDQMPFWSLMRAMFPVAESLGDLIHRNQSTVLNLRSVLAGEFETVRSGYGGKAAILTILYRHSLMHHDELRTVSANGREVGWRASSAEDADHLRVHRNPGTNLILIEFQPRAFYSDIIRICENAAKAAWGGEVMRRYNGWMALDLDAELRTKHNGTFAEAASEIAAL